MALPEVLMSYFTEVGFEQAVLLTDFHFDLTLLSAFGERVTCSRTRATTWSTLGGYLPWSALIGVQNTLGDRSCVSGLIGHCPVLQRMGQLILEDTSR
ncbi:hypothetical protein PIB30_007699 [Stylosanthes scabra]|uniref:Uncharacterized protein n=1 Tax=Stylosanthes scabra TaxID=79078 RepID=A0ABU6X2J0_9FABA|nr:hypothetical protein [Stylosanthes scabra]